MIDFRLPNGISLDLDPGASVQLAGSNPILDIGSIPGTRIYKFKGLPTRTNKINLGFPEQLNLQSKKQKVESVDLYIHKTRWKRGTLRIIDASNDSYDLSFHCDAGDIAQRINGRNLTGIDLGTEALDLNIIDTYPNANYVMFPVHNPEFYGDKNTDFNGIVNNYAGGTFMQNTTAASKYNIVPFPYLLYVLNKTFQALGYRGIAGEWTEDPTIQKVVIYNNFALDALAGGINVFGDVQFNRHVPDMAIGQFLIEVAVTFGINYTVDDTNNIINIYRISDVLSDQSYIDLSGSLSRGYKVTPNEYAGINFRSIPDNSDKLLESNPAWLQYTIDEGKEGIESAASPLLMNVVTDTDQGDRTLEIPVTQQTGSSDEFDQGINRSGLRFMLYEGMANDSAGNPYPKGNYQVPELSLRWAGANGLATACYSEYTTFKQITESVTRDVRMSFPDFFNLDMKRKLMMRGMKYLVGDYSARISRKTGLQPVGMTVWKTLL